MIINLNEKLKSIQQMYNIMIHPADQDKQLIEDTGVAILKFQAFVLRSSDFKEIKFKIDGSIIKDLVELKRKGIELKREEIYKLKTALVSIYVFLPLNKKYVKSLPQSYFLVHNIWTPALPAHP